MNVWGTRIIPFVGWEKSEGGSSFVVGSEREIRRKVVTGEWELGREREILRKLVTKGMGTGS